MVVLIPKRPYGQSDVAGRQPCRAGDTSAFSASPRGLIFPATYPLTATRVPASAGTRLQRDAKPVPTGGQFGAPHFLTTHWPFLS